MSKQEDIFTSFLASLDRPVEGTEALVRLIDAGRQAQKEATQRYEAILNGILEGILTVDADGRIVDVNRAACRILAGSHHDIVGRPVAEVFADPGANQQHKLLNRCIRIVERRLEYRYTETSGRRLDGTVFPLEVTVSPANFDGQTFYLYILRDISRRRQDEAARVQLESELREAQKLEAIGHLAGGIAHEINTPSQYIRDNLDFLNDSYGRMTDLFARCLALLKSRRDRTLPGGAVDALLAECDQADLEFLMAEVPDALAQSLDGIGQISRIVASMKEISHPGGADAAPADLARMLENVAVVSRNQWKHHARLVEDFDVRVPAVPCHHNELNQVFLNLLVNAAHAIADAGKDAQEGCITLSTGLYGDYVRISIADNGTGIAAEDAERIFNPFFTTKEVGRGTGQGLTIAHDIVVGRHKGRLSFDTTPGAGTVFHVDLPLHP